MKLPLRALASFPVVLTLAALACKGREDPGRTAPSSRPAESRLEKVRVKPLPVPVGTRLRETRKTTLALSVEFWRDDEKIGTNEMTRSEDYARSTEVLGTVGGAPSKVRVRYERYLLDEALIGQAPRKDAHLQGQTLVIEGQGDAMTATAADGKPALAEERESLVKLHAGLGVDDPVLEALSKIPLTQDTPNKMNEKLLKGLLRSTATFKGGTFTLVGTKESALAFEWNAESHTEEEGGLDLDWHLKGRFLVSQEPFRVISSEIEGSIDGTGETRQDGKKVKMAGSGTVHDSYTCGTE